MALVCESFLPSQCRHLLPVPRPRPDTPIDELRRARRGREDVIIVIIIIIIVFHRLRPVAFFRFQFKTIRMYSITITILPPTALHYTHPLSQ